MKLSKAQPIVFFLRLVFGIVVVLVLTWVAIVGPSDLSPWLLIPLALQGLVEFGRFLFDRWSRSSDLKGEGVSCVATIEDLEVLEDGRGELLAYGVHFTIPAPTGPQLVRKVILEHRLVEIIGESVMFGQRPFMAIGKTIRVTYKLLDPRQCRIDGPVRKEAVDRSVRSSSAA